MSGEDVKSFFGGFGLNTVILLLTLGTAVFGLGANWSKLNAAIQAQQVANTQVATTAHAEVEAVRTDLTREHDAGQKWISDHEATSRDRLASNTAAQARLDAEIDEVRKDTADTGRKLDQHEYRLTSAETQISQVRQTLEKITEKIDAIDRNVLLLAQRAGVDADDETPKTGLR